MAYLLKDQILKILQSGTNQKPEELQSCHKHDIRAKFHIETKIDSSCIEYLPEYLAWVGSIINKKKLSVFTHLMTIPVETVDFNEGIFDELTKVFDASDRYVGYEFTNPALSQDYETFLKDIGHNTFWRNQGFQALKTAINSIVILDLPAVQDLVKDKFPRPYYYLLDVQRLINWDVNSKFKFEYVIFHNKYDSDIIHAFDDGYYRTFKRSSDGKAHDYTLVSEVPHNLAECPAKSFWSTPFNDRSRIQKRGPQTNALGKMDYLLWLYTATKHAELQAGFPIDVVYEQGCDYRDASGNTCKGGTVQVAVNATLNDGQDIRYRYDECPTCKEKQMLGAGTLLTAPAMASKDDVDLIQGMNRISADTVSLEYLLTRISKYETDISVNMIGFISEGIREAMNKEQVNSMFESQINCLAEVSENFQAIDLWVLEGLAKLRYGTQAVVSITSNWGRKWFIHTVEKLQAEFKESKENGFPNFELSSQFEQIIQTKYKNNPAMLERARTLAAIEPYQNYTVSDIGSLSEKFGLNNNLVHLKLDFSNYVSRFEREYMDVGAFMQYMPFSTKVTFIREKLLEYVEEDYTIIKEEDPIPPPKP